MTNKSEEAYDSVFDYISSHVLELKCHQFMTDYEIALRNSLNKQCPTAILSACWFHFTQAVKRRANKFPTMMNIIRTNNTAKRLFYKVMCLALLPAKYIKDEFFKIEIELQKIHKSAFKAFLLYFQQQWLTNVIHNLSICTIFN